MSIEYVELTITDAEPIQITISDIPEAAPGGGGLTAIPAETLLGNNTGSTALPTGLTAEQARALLSVYSTSQVDTALGQRVLSTDSRLGVIYDVTNDQVALSCDDQQRTFADTTTRDNLRAALQAVANDDTRLGVIWDVSNDDAALSCFNTEWTFFDTTIRDNLRTALQAVSTTDERLGVIYDGAEGNDALRCDDSEWVFGTTTQRDNLRTALEAAAASHTHAASDIASGTLNIALIPTGTTSSTVCIGNDARLSDARTPTAHTHPQSEITNLSTDLTTIRAAIREVITVALSGYDTAISTGDGKGFLRVRIGGRIESVTIDCDPNNEPIIGSIIVDCSKINRTTGAATSVFSTKATIAINGNTGTGTLDGTQSVSAGDLLRFDIDQAADGKELLATVVINPFL